MIRKVLFILVLSKSFAGANAQSLQPEIGKSVPEFMLSKMGNYTKAKMSSQQFRGKFVILDFWNRNCISCVQSFPKLNQLHQFYKGKVDLILVGTDEKGIQEMFASFKSKLNLQFPYTFNMLLYKKFVTEGAPHLVWIDKRGTVQAVTGGSDLTKDNIDAFLRGEKFSFRDISHRSRIDENLNEYDTQTPFLINGNGGVGYDSMFRYRSLITEYIPGMPKKDWNDAYFFRPHASRGVKIGSRSIFEVCTSLEELYRTAYTGYVYWKYGDSIYSHVQPRIIFETADSSLFKYDSSGQIGLYWYSLVMPEEKDTPRFVMETMQSDLKRYFGYNAYLDERKFSYLRLMATQKAKKLITKGGDRNANADHSYFKGTNIPLDQFLRSTLMFHNYWESRGKIPVIINETGLSENVDIDVKINGADWADVKRVLTEMGFELVPAEKYFKVLVIRDPK